MGTKQSNPPPGNWHPPAKPSLPPPPPPSPPPISQNYIDKETKKELQELIMSCKEQLKLIESQSTKIYDLLYNEVDRLNKLLKKIKLYWQDGISAETEDTSVWHGKMRDLLKDVYPADSMFHKSLEK